MWLPANWQQTYLIYIIVTMLLTKKMGWTLYLVTVTVMSSPFTNTISLMMRMTAFIILSSFFLVFYRGRIARCVWCNIVFVSFWRMSLFCFLSLLDFLLFVFLSVEKKNNNRKQKMNQWESNKNFVWLVEWICFKYVNREFQKKLTQKNMIVNTNGYMYIIMDK